MIRVSSRAAAATIQPDKWYRIAELAHGGLVLGFSDSGIRRLLKKGYRGKSLPAHKTSPHGHWRVRGCDLLFFLTSLS